MDQNTSATAAALAPKKVRTKKGARVQLTLPRLGPETEVERRPYWLGTLPDSPVQNITVGGVRFVRATGPMNGDHEFTNPPGQVVQLTEEQVERIKEHLGFLVVRQFGHDRRVLDKQSPTYRYQEGDEYLGRYLYFYELDRDAPHNRPTTKPEPVIGGAWEREEPEPEE